MTLKLKHDFDKTCERFEAWWNGDIIDRPPVTLYVAPDKPLNFPKKSYPTLRERWLDVEFRVEKQAAELERRVWLGDSIPSIRPDVGPDLTGTLWGIELEFSDRTSWSKPIVQSGEEWANYVDNAPDFDNIYWQTVEKIITVALERNDSRYLVELPDLHGSLDIMVSLRGPENICLDLMDFPELVSRTAQHAAHLFMEALERSFRLVKAAGLGSTTWLPLYYDGLGYAPSCDFWGLVSDDVARGLILPLILEEIKPMERSIFHLDGPQALRHLSILLDIPDLDAVQWVYGASNGPASRWIDVYQRCVQAGKSVQVLAETAEDGLEVLKAIGPKHVWITLYKEFPTAGVAEDYLREVEYISSNF